SCSRRRTSTPTSTSSLASYSTGSACRRISSRPSSRWGERPDGWLTSWSSTTTTAFLGRSHSTQDRRRKLTPRCRAGPPCLPSDRGARAPPLSVRFLSGSPVLNDHLCAFVRTLRTLPASQDCDGQRP